jgi:hypothetical protein
MLTIKLMKYGPTGRTITPKTYLTAVAVHSAREVFLDYEQDGRAVLRWDRAGESLAVTVGETGDTSYDVAYIMNEAGKTIETIR